MRSKIGPLPASGRRPRVSICIPNYNGARFLGATVRSALDQDLDDIEVVVQDNASNDSTMDVLAGFDDPRLVVRVSRDFVDLPTNWRRAVDASSGTYVKLLCADDLIHVSAVRLQADLLEKLPQVSLVASRRALIDEHGRTLANNLGLRAAVGAQSGRQIVRRTVMTGGVNDIGEPATTMFRRSDYDAVGGWDGGLLHPMDLDLWIRLFSRGSFFGQDQELAAFRISPDALSASHTPQQYMEHKELLRRVTADPRWRITYRERAASMLLRRLIYETWPLRKRMMHAGPVWDSAAMLNPVPSVCADGLRAKSI